MAFLFLAFALPSTGTTAPYSNDFSGTGANTAFTTEGTDAEWAVSNEAYRNTYSNSSITASTASLSITGVAGNAFTLETRFTVQQNGNINANGSTLGFGFLASSSTFSTTSNSYYLADIQYGNTLTGSVGTLRILSLGDTDGFTAVNGLADDNAGDTALAITAGTTYTLRLQGTYEGGSLSMTFGLFDAAGTTRIGTPATATDATPLTGTYFGFRNRIGIGGGTTRIDFDNYSLTTDSAVPEPSIYDFFGGLSVVSPGAASAAEPAS